MPKVSILLPSFNVVRYIRPCLDSVLHQTLTDLEILCIDAHSTDGTLDILREYAQKDPRIRLILSDQKSYGHQMNLGLKAAQGEYIGIVETDDYVPANMFGDLYAIAVQEQADMVKADFYRFREVETRIERIYNRLDPTDSSYNRIVDPAREPRVFRLIMNTWSGIYSRAFLLQNGIVHNESPGASYQDNGFWFQTFCCARRAYFVDRPYYMNRRDNAESSVANPGKVFCMSEEWAFIYDWLKRDAERFGTFKGVYTLRKYHSLLFTYQRIAPAFREEFIRHFGSEMRRHLEAGEYDRTMFTGYEWRRLRMIAYSPDVYHGICTARCSHACVYRLITGLSARGKTCACAFLRRADRLANRLEMFLSWVRYAGLLRALHRVKWKNTRASIDRGENK